jgi:hypothetical protein
VSYLEVDGKRFKTSEITRVVLHSSTWWTLRDEEWWVEVHLVPSWKTLWRKRIVRLFKNEGRRFEEAERLRDWLIKKLKKAGEA